MLLTGAIFKKSYFLVPWLVIALVEHLVIGVPLIVFFGLISLYLASQLQLYIPAGLMIGTVVSAFFISLSSWFTVYRCHNNFKKGSDYEGYANSTDGQLTQPLLGSGPIPPPLPPNHPAATSGSNGYQLGQYPQYYPPHGGNSRALPTAPHPGGIYPSLANAWFVRPSFRSLLQPSFSSVFIDWAWILHRKKLVIFKSELNIIMDIV